MNYEYKPIKPTNFKHFKVNNLPTYLIVIGILNVTKLMPIRHKKQIYVYMVTKNTLQNREEKTTRKY